MRKLVIALTAATSIATIAATAYGATQARGHRAAPAAAANHRPQ